MLESSIRSELLIYTCVYVSALVLTSVIHNVLLYAHMLLTNDILVQHYIR